MFPHVTIVSYYKKIIISLIENGGNMYSVIGKHYNCYGNMMIGCDISL